MSDSSVIEIIPLRQEDRDGMGPWIRIHREEILPDGGCRAVVSVVDKDGNPHRLTDDDFGKVCAQLRHRNVLMMGVTPVLIRLMIEVLGAWVDRVPHSTPSKEIVMIAGDERGTPSNFLPADEVDKVKW